MVSVAILWMYSWYSVWPRSFGYMCSLFWFKVIAVRDGKFLPVIYCILLLNTHSLLFCLSDNHLYQKITWNWRGVIWMFNDEVIYCIVLPYGLWTPRWSWRTNRALDRNICAWWYKQVDTIVVWPCFFFEKLVANWVICIPYRSRCPGDQYSRAFLYLWCWRLDVLF